MELTKVQNKDPSFWPARHTDRCQCTPRPPNVPLFRALWSLLDGSWGVLKGSSRVLACVLDGE